jgi:formate hydrogenlyase subunit 3/multisubunit Na+/H+ antiporter MnhD subunit
MRRIQNKLIHKLILFLIGIISFFFLIIGIYFLIYTYNLSNPIIFILSFFSFSFLILLGIVGVLYFIFRLPYFKDKKIGEQNEKKDF